MGKGFNNYMCKKFFHPASRDNLKRVWMAEQKADAYKKKQDELRVQYEKEQDLYNNKALLSKESKDKLSVNFMYEPPPGAKKEREKEDGEPEYKFEWQRKYNAPREDYCKGDQDIRDQPFGIQVRNVRCIKCHKWGHINTDKECPMYNKVSEASKAGSSMDPLELMQQMQEDGLALRKNVVEYRQNMPVANQQMIPSDHEEDAEMDFLKSLSTKEKQKLLKKLEKLEKRGKVDKANKKKKKKQKKSRKKQKRSDSSNSESDLESAGEDKKQKKKKKKKKRKKSHSSSTASDSGCSSESEERSKNVKKDNVLSEALGNKRRIEFTGVDGNDKRKEEKSWKSSNLDNSREKNEVSRNNGKVNKNERVRQNSTQILNNKMLRSRSRSTDRMIKRSHSNEKRRNETGEKLGRNLSSEGRINRQNPVERRDNQMLRERSRSVERKRKMFISRDGRQAVPGDKTQSDMHNSTASQKRSPSRERQLPNSYRLPQEYRRSWSCERTKSNNYRLSRYRKQVAPEERTHLGSRDHKTFVSRDRPELERKHCRSISPRNRLQRSPVRDRERREFRRLSQSISPRNRDHRSPTSPVRERRDRISGRPPNRDMFHERNRSWSRDRHQRDTERNRDRSRERIRDRFGSRDRDRSVSCGRYRDRSWSDERDFKGSNRNRRRSLSKDRNFRDRGRAFSRDRGCRRSRSRSVGARPRRRTRSRS